MFGHSFLAENAADAESYRWKAYDAEPHSSFAAIRLLELYAYGPMLGRDIYDCTRLPETRRVIAAQFKDNTAMAVADAVIVMKQYDYDKADAALATIVQRDPQMARAHFELSHVARCREDAELAKNEAKAAVDAWPRNPCFHTSLAQACSLAASNARCGRYFSGMSQDRKVRWRANSTECIAEAIIATKLDPNCYEAWTEVLRMGRELSYPNYLNHAFSEMIRIDPKNPTSYVEYGFAHSPQWGGSEGQETNTVALAAKTYGPGAPETQIVEAAILRHYVDNSGTTLGGSYNGEMICESDSPLIPSKSIEEGSMLVDCRNAMLARRRAEMYELANKGFQTWHSLEWQ